MIKLYKIMSGTKKVNWELLLYFPKNTGTRGKLMKLNVINF